MAEYTKKYNPNRSAEWNYGGDKWKLSRSKIDFYIECPRCFYIDNKLGTKRPGMPSFNLNIAVDELFKKEFDVHRAAGTKHPLLEKYTIDAVPFKHKDLDTWRDPFVGLMYTDPDTGLVVSGGIDDVWQHSDGSLIVVDYKATSKEGSIVSLADSAWEEQYERQIGVLFQQSMILGVARFSAEQGLNPTSIPLLTPTVAGREYAIVFYSESGDRKFNLAEDVQLAGEFATFTAK